MAKTTTKPDNPVRLRAYLGLNEQGVPEMFVSTTPLNPVGTRLEKGMPFPEELIDWQVKSTWPGALYALTALQVYFDQQAEKGRR